MLATRQITPLDRARSRIAEMENTLLATKERQEERVSELLEANNREVTRRREAEHERDAWKATAEELGKAIVTLRAERDTANRALEQAAREIGEDSMALDEGTES